MLCGGYLCTDSLLVEVVVGGFRVKAKAGYNHTLILDSKKITLMEELIFGSLIVWALGRIAKKKAECGQLQARSLHLHSKCLALVVQITTLPLVDLVDLHTILTILVVTRWRPPRYVVIFFCYSFFTIFNCLN
jgi:hypothetical protein